MQPWVPPAVAIEDLTTYKDDYRLPRARADRGQQIRTAPTPLHYQRSSDDYGSDGKMGRQRPSTAKWLTVHRGTQDWRGGAPDSRVALQRWWHAEPRMSAVNPSRRCKQDSDDVAAGMASLDQSIFGFNPPAASRAEASSFMQHEGSRPGGAAYERSSDAIMGRRPASAARRQANVARQAMPQAANLKAGLGCCDCVPAAGMASRPSDRAKGARFESIRLGWQAKQRSL